MLTILQFKNMSSKLINTDLSQAPFNIQLQWLLAAFSLESCDLAESLVTDEQIIDQG